MLFKYFEAFKKILRPFVDRSALLQSAGFWTFRNLPFLLPHDSEYCGISKLFKRDTSGVVLDVGANMGLSALTILRMMPNVEIIALEPNPLHERSLHRIRRKNPSFDYKIVAAGREFSKAKIFVPKLNYVSLHTMASISIQSVKETLNSSAAPRNASRNALINSYDVDVITVDSLKINPTFIKIDVEGGEYDVLLGAVRTIREFRPILFIEISEKSFNDCLNFLTFQKYKCKYYDTNLECFTDDYSGKRNAFFTP